MLDENRSVFVRVEQFNPVPFDDTPADRKES